ncbi:SLFN8 protein, partial [Thinocorus orbignyianus]|nr:SLFN8 protein [Thinocorus orbignyianus]
LYPKNYILSSRDIPMFLRALVIVVLSFRSYLSDLLGCEIFNLLTLRQYEVLSNNLLKTKKQYVFGLPGSGKTIVALKIIERIRNIFHCSAEEILYVCENQPLKKFVENQNCRSVTRVAFEKEVFPEVKHIVMDEAQNFRYNGSWYKLACNIVKSRNGIFWVFMDFFQSTHLQDSGLNFSQLYPQEWLTEVVRNAQPIYNVMFDLMRKILQAPENVNRMPYHVMTALFREAKCAHSVSGDFIEKREMETSEMVEYVTTQCISYIRQGYPLGDIAILCSTQSAAQQFRDILQLDLKRKLMKCRVRLIFKSAEEVLANVLVLDSVRRFSGLERRIVFCIHPVPAEKKLSLHLQLCAVSRAHTKLHLLFHKDNE